MNCKPGDMAIVIKSLCGNDGKIVKIVRGLGENPEFEGFFWCWGMGFCWLAEFQSPSPDAHGGMNKSMPIPDAWLRPISGLPDAEDIDTAAPIKTSEPACS